MGGVDAIDRKLAKLKMLQQQLPKIAMDVFMENEAVILDMNFDEQLYMEGINANNVPIMDYKPYQPLTMEIKAHKNQPYDRVTLKDEGDFHSDAIIDRIDDLTAEIDSTNVKRDALVKKYGKDIFGLTDNNMDEVREFYIKPDLLKKMNDEL